MNGAAPNVTSQLQLSNNVGIKYHRMLILMGIEATISYAAVPENDIPPKWQRKKT